MTNEVRPSVSVKPDQMFASGVLLSGFLCLMVNVLFTVLASGGGYHPASQIGSGADQGAWQRFLLIYSRSLTPFVILIGGLILFVICQKVASQQGRTNDTPVSSDGAPLTRERGNRRSNPVTMRLVGLLLVFIATVYHVILASQGGPCTSRADMCWKINEMIEAAPFLTQAGIPLVLSVAGIAFLGFAFARRPTYRASSLRDSVSQ